MRFRKLAVALLCASSASCGADPDNWPERRPKIDNLTFAQQSPQDPYGLEFLIDFTDSDGDTGTGLLHLSIDDRRVSELSLTEIFNKQRPELLVDATAATFEVVVKLGADIAVGEQVRVGFVIEDAAGHESNDPWIELAAISGSGGT